MFRRMGASISPGARRQTLLWVVLALNIGGLLFAGLNVQGWEFRNGVEWAPDGSGLEFGRHGLAYTETFSTHDPAQESGQGFTVEMAVRPSEGEDRGFRFIAVVHSGDDGSQLLIGQWRQTIIVMNGDDYDHSRRSPRLSAALSTSGARPVFLAVTSDARGTALYLDGTSVASRADMTLRLPTDGEPGRLVLGNSVYGNNPWSGKIVGFALHPVVLDEETLQNHLESWRRGHGFAGGDYSAADVAYPLSGQTSRRALDRSSSGVDLQFPREQTFIDPSLFASGANAPRDLVDIGLNLCGFIPLGFLLVALFGDVARSTRLSALGGAVAIGFALSGSIELAQAWIPSRSSTLQDLLLNVAGTGVGGMTFMAVAQPLRKWAAWGSNANTA